MSCHPHQLRASCAGLWTLLLAVLVTASAYGDSSSLDPVQGSSPTEVIVSGLELQPNYVAPSELGEKPGSAFTVPADYNGTFGTRSSQLRQASVALTPADGPPGTVTIADGSGFTPNQPVTVTQSEGLIVTEGSTTIRADQSGSITMTFRIADQTPPGVINVTFVQEENTATAQFRVRRAASGTGGASTQPIKGTIDEFTQWLNACVNGRLNIPMCTTGG